jgi:hypothetical protein
LPDGYNEANLQPERFLQHIEVAIIRAKAMNIETDDYPRTLGTDIYKLVEKVISSVIGISKSTNNPYKSNISHTK